MRGFTRFSAVGAGGVEGVLGQDVAGVGVDDGGLVVVDEADDLGAGVGSADAEVEQAAAVAEADLSVAGRRCRNARTRGSGPAGASVAHVRTTGHEEGMALLDDFVAALDLAARDHGLVTRPQLVAERLSSSSIARLANTRRALRPLGGGVYVVPALEDLRSRHMRAALQRMDPQRWLEQIAAPWAKPQEC